MTLPTYLYAMNKIIITNCFYLIFLLEMNHDTHFKSRNIVYTLFFLVS